MAAAAMMPRSLDRAFMCSNLPSESFMSVLSHALEPHGLGVAGHFEIADAWGGAGVAYGAFPVRGGGGVLSHQFLIGDGGAAFESDFQRRDRNAPFDGIACSGFRAGPVFQRLESQIGLFDMPGA